MVNTLDQGQSVLVTGILVGATVASAPSTGLGTRNVQVDILTAQAPSGYEGRWFSLPPRPTWGTSYYAPAGSSSAADPVTVYLHNPNAAAITVVFQRLVAGVLTSSNINVPAGTTVLQGLPSGAPLTAARFSAPSAFYAVTATAPNSTIYDWGHSLIPEASLTPAAVVGWAPGSTDLNRNVNPVWVTPVNPPGGTTTIYVDEDGDPTTGLLLDPTNGDRYDVACVVTTLRSLRVFSDGAAGVPVVVPAGCTGTACTFPANSCVLGATAIPPGDNDQTGMRLYTRDGTKIAAAWGEDVSLANSGQPTELDMGTTVVPFASLNAFKDGTLLVDLNGNGGIDAGDTLLYTTVVRNVGIIPILLVRVTDTLDLGTAYVPGTFEVDGIPVVDDAGPSFFPLDLDAPHTSGFVLVESPAGAPAPIYSTPFPPGGRIVITYQAVVLASAVDPIVNRVTVTSSSETFVDTSSNPIPSSILQVTKTSNVPADAVPGQDILYTVTVTNPASSPAGVTGVRLTDPLPAGTTYVASSTSVTGPRQLSVADRFGTITPSYDNSNGPNPWDSNDVGTVENPWTELNDGGTNPAAGDARVVIGPGGGELRLDNQSGGGAVEVSRPLDLSAFTTGFGFARFDFRVDLDVDMGDSIGIDCSGDNGTNYTPLGTIDWIDGDVGGTLVSGSWANVMPAGCLTALNRLRLRVAAGYNTVSNEFFYADNVEVRAVGTAKAAVTDDFATFPTSGTGWTAAWAQTGSPTAGGGGVRLNGGGTPDAITRSANLTGLPRAILAVLSFNLTTSASLEDTDILEVEASNGVAGFTTLARYLNDPAGGVRTLDLTPYISATTTVRFRVTTGTTTAGEFFQVDDVQILTGGQAAVVKDNITGPVNADLLDGVPGSLTLPADSYALAPGESLTATYHVLVNNPQALTRIVNTVAATAHETVQPVRATVIDPIGRGGMIGDRVWLDVDSDGVQDIGEPGIAGVRVELTNGVCTPLPAVGANCPTMLTDLNGNYLFDVLPPGSYTVVVDTLTVPAGLLAPLLAPTQPSVVTATQVFTTVDFGYRPPTATATIGDRVWADADSDGIQDPGEIGIGGVTVQLRSAGTDGILGTGDDVIVASTTTDPDGTYLFTSVAAGTYAVLVSGAPLTGRTATVGPQSVGANLSPPVTLTAGQVRTDIDFGYTAPGTFSITDTFWVDEDRDTVYDPVERPIAGVTVNLVCAAVSAPVCTVIGNVIGTTTTGTAGTFTFSGVPNGTYNVVATDNGGILAGRERTTPNAVAGQRTVTVAGANLTGAHFGYAQPGLLGDRVWSDNDNDGVQDPNEPGLGGVTVELRGPGADGLLFTADDLLPGGLIATAVTRADGSYEFNNLVAGGYRVIVPVQAATTGYTQTGDPNQPNILCTTCDRQGSSTVTMLSTDRSLDFGFRDTTRPDVSGTVYHDANRNAVLDTSPPESGLGGVTVALVNAGTDGIFGNSDDLVVATATTAANGTYSFPDVQAGNYQVQVRDAAGVLDSYTLTSGRDQIPITVAAANITGIDFGYARATPTGSIGDTLWIDVDPPGANPPDGLPGPTEPRLPGVTVNLYRDLNGNGVIDGPDGAAIATTVTDVNGQYIFTGLAAGNYLVDVVEATLPDSVPGVPFDLIETTYPPGVNPSRVINLSDGQRYLAADFGYRPRAGTVVLGDFVWYDTDGDGLQDPGEMGIPGIDVNVIWAGPDNNFATTGDNVTTTTTTDVDGSYLFTGLPAGMYLATYDQTDITALGLTNQPTNLAPGNRTFSLTAVAGDVFATLDFGFNGGAARGSIGDLIWVDVNNNGAQNAGELGIPGVTVNLRNSGGVVIATTTTDANGNYLFSGLPAATYTVQITDIDGVLTGLNLRAPVTNPTSNIVLGAGVNNLTIDFPYVPSAGTGTIGTTVWHDLDFDGVRDAGEPPLEGVTLNVYFDTNGNGSFTPGVDNRVRTVVTDSGGNFELLGLPLGTYFVDVTDTAGVTTGFTKTTGTAGVDNNSQADPYTVVLTGGAPNNVTADFGYRDNIVGGSLAISGTTFVDANVSGTYQPGAPQFEVPVQSVAVRLYRVVNGVHRLIGITTSAANGTYSFADLPPGDYAIRVDPSTTLVDGFLQTTQTTTGGVQLVTLSIASSTGNDFGFYAGPVTTTPVTLSYFEAEGTASSFVARWKTATEVGHVGFNLWAADGDSKRRLNDQLIRSAGGDSLEIRSYELQVSGAGSTKLFLQEVDVKGRSRFHGPFLVGQRYGNKNLTSQRIGWAAIGLEHAAKLRERENQARAVSGTNTALLLRIDTDGIHRVTYEQLVLAGLDLGIAPLDEDIAVTHQGQPVPIRVEPSGAFGPGSYVELVADGLDTLYTGTDVYRITVDPAQAERVGTDANPPTGVVETSYREPMRLEGQLHYSFASPTDDPWYDKEILAFLSPQSVSFGFQTADRVAGPVTLHVDLWGVTDWPQAPDHHAVMRVNGTEVGDVEFDGNDVVPFTAADVEGALLPGANTLQIELPGDTGVDFDLVHVDGFTVEYPRQLLAVGGSLDFTGTGDSFEVQGLPSDDIVVYRRIGAGAGLTGGGGGSQLERLTGTVVTEVSPGNYSVSFPGAAEEARYLVASAAAITAPGLAPARDGSDIRTGTAELLVIAHPDFISGLAPLVQQRQTQGWSVKVVDVEDVYAEFGGDVFDPAAIESYVAFAVANLETRAVLLVGGDTYDYRNYLGFGGLSFIPSLYAPAGDVVRYAPADGLFADTNGDRIPDVAIGRFPVRTSADVDALVGKTLQYGALLARKTLLLGADAFDQPTNFSFAQSNEEITGWVPPSWQIDRVYLDTLTVLDARAELLARLNGGVAVASYMGHSGPSSWTFGGLFNNADAAGLLNNGQPTVALQWGCWASYFVEPANNTLAHALLLNGNKGAAAVMGASTLTDADLERAFALEVFARVFQQDATLGQGILDAKRDLAQGATADILDLLLGWNLLGDPTLGLGGDATGGASGLPFATGFEAGDQPWSAAVGQ